jgi:hypothetical protein
MVICQINDIELGPFEAVDAATVNAQDGTALLDRSPSFNQRAFKIYNRQIRIPEFCLKIVKYPLGISLLK